MADEDAEIVKHVKALKELNAALNAATKIDVPKTDAAKAEKLGKQLAKDNEGVQDK